jgi:agmatine deiminase
MKKYLTGLFFILLVTKAVWAQAIFTSAPKEKVRTMAEWEELQAIAIAWDNQFPNILTEIVKNAQKEVNVLIVCRDSSVFNTAKTRLLSKGIDLAKNITFIVRPNNTIWIRDYGPNSIYYNDVDSLAFVDWRYNRNRPNDDVVAEGISKLLKKSVFKTLSDKEDLLNTGGNFMTDGLGTAFASKLVLDENDGQNPSNIPFATAKTEQQIDDIMQRYMGIDRYIKMNNLPFDGIHHIDMHMKLLDEETLLVGEYPQGRADGPQIEANLQYVLKQFKTSFGKSFDVVRVPMPPDQTGKFPDTKGYYRTYANAVFVNKTVLVPTYELKYDSTALNIWQKALPGHQIVGIDCNAIIPQSGAIHCITKEIGVNQPLWIAHSKLRPKEAKNTTLVSADYIVEAFVKHYSGIQTVTIFYKEETATGWKTATMRKNSNNLWTATVSLTPGVNHLYYINAEAKDGKVVTRPLTGEKGAWKITPPTIVNSVQANDNSDMKVYPNPCKAITCIEIESSSDTESLLQFWSSKPGTRQKSILFRCLNF